MSAKPQALLVTPVPPRSGWNGSAMRVAGILSALADTHEVALQLTGHYGLPNLKIEESLMSLVEELRCGASIWDGKHFDLALGFRLSSWPLVAGVDAGRKILDLDEVDSRRELRLAKRAGDLGLPEVQATHSRAARLAKLVEKRYIREMDQLLVSSKVEREHLAADFQIDRERVTCLPNSVIACEPVGERLAGPPQFLFVGTLSYLPNWDAINWMRDEIAQELKNTFGTSCGIDVVGNGQPVRDFPDPWPPGMQMRGFVRDLRPLYARASACLVPIRCGAGTRLKVLEAFAMGRPVISTGLGVEGLEVIEGEHYLRAETAKDFATAARSLVEEPTRWHQLVSSGLGFVRRNHSYEAVGRSISQALSMAPRCSGRAAASVP